MQKLQLLALQKWTLRIALACAGALWIAWALVVVCRTARLPPRFGNEAELLYEASRLARGLPLYGDPLAGFRDDGAMTIHHYVLYGGHFVVA